MGCDLAESRIFRIFSPASCCLPILQDWDFVFISRLYPVRFSAQIWNDRQRRDSPFSSAFLLWRCTHHPWVGWGPAATHIFPIELRADVLPQHRMATPAGPFWVMEDTQLRLVIQDYDWLRKWKMQATVENTPSLSKPTVTAAKATGQHWVAGEVETHLLHRDVVTIESRDQSMYGTRVLIDREWFLGISRGVSIRF